MAGSDRAERTTEDGGITGARPACVALVPVNPPAPSQPTSSLRSSRPSSVFVAHLIATAAQAPQTRSLRRATPADAQTAYSANRYAFQGAGFRTRQII
jgi:hypothetical protein